MEFYRMLNHNKMECNACGKVLSGSNKNNIVRHYRLIHKTEISLLKRRKFYSLDSKMSPESLKIPLEIEMPLEHIKVLNEADLIEALPKRTKLCSPSSREEDYMDKNQFLECCLGLVAIKNIPLHIFDDQEFFKTLIHPYEEKFNMNLSSQYMMALLETSGSIIQNIIRTKLANQMVSLKLDIATRGASSVLVVNLQCIVQDKIAAHTLGMIVVEKPLSETDLISEVSKCLTSYQLEFAQIYSCCIDKISHIAQYHQLESIDDNYTVEEYVTMDDIEYILLKSFDSELKISQSAAHCLHLVGLDVLKNLEPQIEDCRKVIRHLRDLIRSNGSYLNIPTLGFSTQWHSVYEMLKCLLNYRYADNDEIIKSFLLENEVNWDFVSDFIVSFAPLANFCEHLQLKQYIFGDFYRDWLNCEIELEDIASDTALLLHVAMQKRKKMLVENKAFLSALYLDPRFNFRNSTILTDKQKSVAVSHLLEIFAFTQKLNSIKIKSEPLDIASEEYDDQPVTSKTAYAKLTQRIMNSTMRLPECAETKQSFRQKLTTIINTKMATLDSDILEYWHSISLDPDLVDVMNVALAVPVSQVSLERAYSALAVTKFDNNLQQSTLNNLLLTKLYFPEINKHSVTLEISEQ